MKLSTKSVASLLVAATVAAAVPGLSQLPVPKRRRESHFDRLLQRHDRKGEMRADILCMGAYEFRYLAKSKTLDEIIKSRGMSKRAFRMALVGRLRDELLRRGWSRTRIETYVIRRATRLA